MKNVILFCLLSTLSFGQTIYVKDKSDPRYKMYHDSLFAYKQGLLEVKTAKEWLKNPLPQMGEELYNSLLKRYKLINPKIKSIGNIDTLKVTRKITRDYTSYWIPEIFKKPVIKVLIAKPKAPEVVPEHIDKVIIYLKNPPKDAEYITMPSGDKIPKDSLINQYGTSVFNKIQNKK